MNRRRVARATRLRLAAAVMLLAGSASASTLSTATITMSALSPDCLDYRIVGICYWLHCSWYGCSVRTSVKIRHYVPDAVVSSYANTGANPWIDVRPLSLPNPMAQAGGDGTTSHSNENDIARFKNADVIGDPAGVLFSRFAGGFGFACSGSATPLMPYLLSTLDTVAWRYNIPESVYPEALIPGIREIGSRAALDLWGNVYPRGGFLHETDDYMTGAVVAQRAGDIVTRRGQLHVYQPLLATAHDGYWPAGALKEGDASTGKWQELTPTLSSHCAVFPNSETHVQATDGAYAWALWRPYTCCKRMGEIFLGSTDFN
ncbi:TIGR03756 family integrating conjugative element protein [Gluconacetobacter sp. Hr-1-5]|uniref:TIGR03756 family integrating conjugative element protein n=1 Tax=Gluconacetobacter sp. Hr-1-5 TaxID=3395370 RepID=UPI003B519AA9